MNYEDKHQRMIERLEKRHEQMLERMEKQQDRLNERMERQRDMLNTHMEREMSRAAAQLERAMKQDIPALSEKQQKIVNAALELLKTKGLGELSLREIAKSLHMQAPAIYWHFKSKEVLVDFMAEAILKKEFPTLVARQDPQSWQDWLVNHMMRLRKAMLAYPDGARVVAGAHPYPAVTLGESFNCALESLHSAGIDLSYAARVVMTATTYTFGYVIEEQASPSPEDLADFDWTVFRESAPLVAELMGIRRKNYDADADYKDGLELIIDGATGALKKQQSSKAS
jgi:TetR/AcrR family transcriptional regulator, tetracycline repressor protein